VFIAGFLKTLDVGYTGQSAQTYAPNYYHYYRLEMYLKQAKTVPMEYAVTVGGLKNLMIDTLKEVTGSTHVHQEFRKIIEQTGDYPQSETPIEASFWARFEMESEGGLLDKKALMDTLRNYHYNPLVALQFIGTETAVTPLGKPTIRYHKYTLVHNPKMSTTKAMEINIKLAAAIKNNREIIKHIASSSEKKLKHEEKISTSLTSSPLKNSETAYIANALVEIKRIGGPRRTYDYSITAAKGTKEQVHKWNLVLEAETEPKMICVTGELEFPVTRTLAHNPDYFKFQNKIGFGTTCEESFVKLVGTTKTSERQRSYSRRSEAAKECEKLSREVIQIYSTISSASQQEKASLEREGSIPRRLRWRSPPPPAFLSRFSSSASTLTPSSRATLSSTLPTCPTLSRRQPDPSRSSSASTRGPPA
jgi:hypothetical protein